MGALSGTISASAFYVLDEVPKDFKERFIAGLEKRRFKELDPNSDEDEALGWVNLFDPFDTAFTVEKLLWNDYLVFSLRHDQIRIPAPLFKLYLRKEIANWCAETGKERPSRTDEEELKDRLHKQLRKRVLPSIKTIDVVWNLERREVWFWTANKRMTEMFMDFFTDTFGLPLAPRNAYSRLERMGLPADVLALAVALEPSSFAAPPDERR